MYQHTSRLAYAKARTQLGNKQSEVLEALEMIQPATDAMLASYLNWTINRVTPRRNELRKLGYLEPYKVDTCKVTGSTAIFWMTTDSRNDEDGRAE